MMRGRHAWGVAVRQPSGDIACHLFPFVGAAERHSWLKLPVVRGVLALVESLTLGVKALGLSASLSMEGAETDAASPDAGSDRAEESSGSGADADATEESSYQFGTKELVLTVGLAAVLAVVLFVVIPLVVVKRFESALANPFLFNLVEGLIRIVIFLLYISAISLIPDLRRVFQYHGAEHEVIHAYEAGVDLDRLEQGGRSTLHPRCGTGFLLVVMVLSVFVFALVGKPALLWLVLSRILGIPVIAGLSYEIIKFAGRHPSGLVARVLLWPGLQLQRLTTRQPTPDQLEVAATVLRGVVDMERSVEARG